MASRTYSLTPAGAAAAPPCSLQSLGAAAAPALVIEVTWTPPDLDDAAAAAPPTTARIDFTHDPGLPAVTPFLPADFVQQPLFADVTPVPAAPPVPFATLATLATLAPLTASVRADRRVSEVIAQAAAGATTVGLSFLDIGDVGVTRLANSLRRNTTVTTMWLHGNKIGDVGARALAALLRENDTVTTVILQRNEISTVGAYALADGLKDNDTVTMMDLNRNPMSREAMRAVDDAIAQNPFDPAPAQLAPLAPLAPLALLAPLMAPPPLFPHGQEAEWFARGIGRLAIADSTHFCVPVEGGAGFDDPVPAHDEDFGDEGPKRVRRAYDASTRPKTRGPYTKKAGSTYDASKRFKKRGPYKKKAGSTNTAALFVPPAAFEC